VAGGPARRDTWPTGSDSSSSSAWTCRWAAWCTACSAGHAEDATRTAVANGDGTGNARLLFRHYGLLHYTALAGLLAYTTGLRRVGADLTLPGAGLADDRQGLLWAICLAGGLAVFTATIAVMWCALGRPTPGIDLAGAAVMAALIPVLARPPALIAVAALAALAGLVLAVQAAHARRARPHMAHAATAFPWPRRDPAEGTSPLELLCDVSFVAALAQSVRLIRLVPGLNGVVQALALAVTVFMLWLLGNCTSGVASLRPPAAKAAVLAQTAMFVLLAVIASAPWPSSCTHDDPTAVATNADDEIRGLQFHGPGMASL